MKPKAVTFADIACELGTSQNAVSLALRKRVHERASAKDIRTEG